MIRLADSIWLVLGLYWAISARGIKKSEHAAAPGLYFLHVCTLVFVFVLALSTDLRFGILGRRFLPDTPLFSWCGIFILAASASYAIWARWHLGKNWSGNLVIRPDHRLIRTGPYAFSRHPIYTGIIGGMFGTMLVVGEWRGLLALVLIAVHYRIKVSREEKWLLQHLGAEYSQYCREVRAIIPFIL